MEQADPYPVTADPAQWFDWIDAVQGALEGADADDEGTDRRTIRRRPREGDVLRLDEVGQHVRTAARDLGSVLFVAREA